ncbi:MAG: IS66 family insertion sequence element accessory protein TnpA [Steroidobacteraceae bacterium]
MRRVKRRRLVATEWRELLSKFAESALSVQAFCQQEGVSPSTFNWWRSRLNGTSRTQRSSAPSSVVPAAEFVDLGTLRATAVQPERFELRLDLGAGLVLQLVRG